LLEGIQKESLYILIKKAFILSPLTLTPKEKCPKPLYVKGFGHFYIGELFPLKRYMRSIPKIPRANVFSQTLAFFFLIQLKPDSLRRNL
jgi:hypothetical protein